MMKYHCEKLADLTFNQSQKNINRPSMSKYSRLTLALNSSACVVFLSRSEFLFALITERKWDNNHLKQAIKDGLTVGKTLFRHMFYGLSVLVVIPLLCRLSFTRRKKKKEGKTPITSSRSFNVFFFFSFLQLDTKKNISLYRMWTSAFSGFIWEDINTECEYDPLH